MGDEQKLKERPRNEHVALTEESSRKVKKWLEQIESKRVRLSKKDFLNWFISKSPDNLSSGDLNSVVGLFYNEEAFLRRLLKEVKTSKKTGVPGNHEIVIKQKRADKTLLSASIEQESVQSEDIGEASEEKDV